MPVIGHALVGFATGVYTKPNARSSPISSDIRGQYWILALVVLAYLPDIAAQSLQAAGVRDVSRLTHSIGFVALSMLPCGWLLSRIGMARLRVATAVAFFTLGLHIALDVLQGTDRAILWPLVSRRVSLGFSLIPTSLTGEAALLGVVTLLALVPRLLRRRAFALRRAHAVPAVAVALIVALALTTHALRDRREKQLRYAKWLIEEQRAYTDGLSYLDEAERWPSAAKPGRVDYLRAEAFGALGDRARAEEYYLSSYAADPSYYWVVADIALFYASGPEPAAARRAAVAPYVARLAKNFPRRRDAPRVIRDIEARLGQ